MPLLVLKNRPGQASGSEATQHDTFFSTCLNSCPPWNRGWLYAPHHLGMHPGKYCALSHTQAVQAAAAGHKPWLHQATCWQNDWSWAWAFALFVQYRVCLKEHDGTLKLCLGHSFSSSVTILPIDLTLYVFFMCLLNFCLVLKSK